MPALTRSQRRKRLEIEHFQDFAQLQWDLFRLTKGPADYNVVASVLAFSTLLGRQRTEILPYSQFLSWVENFQRREAAMLDRPRDHPLSVEDFQKNLIDLAGRGVLECETASDSGISIRLMFENWRSLASIRKDHNGQIVPRER